MLVPKLQSQTLHLLTAYLHRMGRHIKADEPQSKASKLRWSLCSLVVFLLILTTVVSATVIIITSPHPSFSPATKASTSNTTLDKIKPPGPSHVALVLATITVLACLLMCTVCLCLPATCRDGCWQSLTTLAYAVFTRFPKIKQSQNHEAITEGIVNAVYNHKDAQEMSFSTQPPPHQA